MKFLTIDNQALIQFGLKFLIETHFPDAAIHQVANKDAAFDALEEENFDLVFIGIHDDEQDGFTWLSKVKALRPLSKFLVYLPFEEQETRNAYLRAGADEVVSFRAGLNEIADCFRILLEATYVTPRHG
ncbi:response regulator [Dyadobacter sandarakinus]|uniref:Response regulator transcription factor n=1 Tax=Dyadobacter sandarakinus TaxID=2747268 RepID=A0ABX7I0H4_9BACT|nr:response regulator [Dyadobacter sandarakinus]QRQ99523.1 response regulator transcription factor [Dyadobacter sandarakinus]